jgi:hypothetical protein
LIVDVGSAYSPSLLVSQKLLFQKSAQSINAKPPPTTVPIQSPLNFAIDLTIRVELTLFVWFKCRLSNSLEKNKPQNNANEKKRNEMKRVSEKKSNT